MNAKAKNVLKIALGGAMGLILVSLLTQYLVRIGLLSDGQGVMTSMNGVFGTVIGGVVTNVLSEKADSPGVAGQPPGTVVVQGVHDAMKVASAADERIYSLKLYAHDLIASKLTGFMVLYLAVAHFIAGVADVKLEPWLKPVGNPAFKFVATYLQSCLVVASCILLVSLLLKRYVALTGRPSLRNALRFGSGGVFLGGLISLLFIHPTLYPLLSTTNKLDLGMVDPFKPPFGEMPFFGISYLQFLILFRLVLLPLLAMIAVVLAHRYWLRKFGL